MKLFPLELTDFAGFVCVAITIITSIGGGIGPGAILGELLNEILFDVFTSCDIMAH
jgi:hypothetical protein